MTELEWSTQTIAEALYSRHRLRFNYHHFSRVVEPYALETDDSGNLVLTAWQVSGGSECGTVVGMKRFCLGDICGLTSLLERFDGMRPFGAAAPPAPART